MSHNVVLILMCAVIASGVGINGYNIVHKKPQEIIGYLACNGEINHPPIVFEIVE